MWASGLPEEDGGEGVACFETGHDVLKIVARKENLRRKGGKIPVTMDLKRGRAE